VESPLPPRVVAVVDDDALFRTALLRALRAEGFAAVGFASAEAFLTSPPAGALCVILDVHLPGMSGLDLLRHLRAADRTLPVVIMTARDDAKQRAEESGCSAFLVKPVDSSVLLNTLSEIANHSGRPS